MSGHALDCALIARHTPPRKPAPAPRGIIAGAGFAAMAWRLACSRSESLFTAGRVYYASREDVQGSPPGCYPAHREYYRILDEAETGLRIWHSARRRGWPTSVKVIL